MNNEKPPKCDQCGKRISSQFGPSVILSYGPTVVLSGFDPVNHILKKNRAHLCSYECAVQFLASIPEDIKNQKRHIISPNPVSSNLTGVAGLDKFRRR